MRMVDAHHRPQQELLGVLEVLVEDVGDVFGRKAHFSQYIPSARGPGAPPRGSTRRCPVMTRPLTLACACALALLQAGAAAQPAAPAATRQLPGLSEPVEIIRDRWGVNHIY